jgi:hypothetical protein
MHSEAAGTIAYITGKRPSKLFSGFTIVLYPGKPSAFQHSIFSLVSHRIFDQPLEGVCGFGIKVFTLTLFFPFFMGPLSYGSAPAPPAPLDPPGFPERS